MIVAKNGNNRTWKSLQTFLLIGTLVFLFMDKIVLPNVNSGKLADRVNAQAQDIAVLKELVIALRPLPAEVYGLKASMDGMVKSLSRVEQKLDSHIERR